MDNNSRTQPSFRSMDVVPPGAQPPKPNLTTSPPPAPGPAPAGHPNSNVIPQAGDVSLAQQSNGPAAVDQSSINAPPLQMANPPSSDPDKELDHIMGEVDAHSANPVHGHDKSKRQRPIMIAVIALVVAVALAVVAVFAFRNTQKVSPAPAVTDVNSGKNSQQVQPVTTSELDTLSKSIDTQTGAFNDTQDFASTDTSDTALGL